MMPIFPLPFVGADGRSLVLTDLHERVLYSEPDARSDRPILGAILGDEACLMVDAGASRAHGQAFLAALEQAVGRRPNLVALTHWHWDHSFGLAGLGIPGIAQRHCCDRLAALSHLAWTDEALAERVELGQEIDFCARMIAAEYGEDREIAIAVPERSFEDEALIELGNLDVRLVHCRSDHSEDSTVVLIPELRIAFLGDILGPAYYERPVRYRPNRFLGLVEELLSLPVDTFLEGHGAPIGRGRLVDELAAHLAVARAVAEGQRDRAALIRLAETAAPHEDAIELHRLVAFMLRGAEDE